MNKTKSSRFRVSGFGFNSKDETRKLKVRESRMNLRQRFVQTSFLCCLILILALPAASLAQRKTLRVSYPAPATVYLPLWVASDAGIFRKHGLDVELVHVGSSPISMAAFLAGEIDVLGGGWGSACAGRWRVRRRSKRAATTQRPRDRRQPCDAGISWI